MSQYVINIGSLPNDGTGDPLRTAFNDVNLNFNQVFAAGPVLSNIQIANNTILTTNTNGNLVLAPNGIGAVVANVNILPNLSNTRNLGSSTLRWASLYTRSLDVTGVINLGNVANLHISGGTNGYVLQTDGAGNLNWVAQSGAGNGSPGGANTQVQFNDDGLFSGVTAFTFDQVSNTLSVPNVVTNTISSDDSSFVTVQDGLNVQGDITAETVSVAGNITGNYFVGDGSQLLNIPVGNNGAVQIAWLGAFSNQGGTPGDTYSTLQFDSNGIPTLDGTTAYQQRVDYSPYLQVLAPRVESTDFGIVAGPAIQITGYADDVFYNTPRSAYLSVQDQANATQQWDFGILGNGSNNFSISNRTGNRTWTFGNVDVPDGLYWPDGSFQATAFVGSAQYLTNPGCVSVTTDSTGNTAYIWTFDTDGNLTLPGNTSSINYANGQPYSGSGGANTGNVTFNDVNIIGTGNLNLQPSVGSSEYLNIYLTGNADIHVAAGNGSGNVIIGTDEGSNVAVLQDGNVTIQAGNVGGTKTWAFDPTGNLTLPSNSVVYETNIPDGALSGSAIALKPVGGTTANQQLLIYPTANDGDHIHLTSGNLYSTELYFGSDDLYVKLANTGNIVINSNDGNSSNAMWTFGVNGGLRFPDNSSIGGGEGVFGITSDFSVGIFTNAGPNINQWLFSNTGNLTLPGNTFAVNYANGTPVTISGGSGNTGNVTFDAANISTNLANTNIQIIGNGTGNINVSANTNTWTFGADGTTLFPGDDILAPINNNLRVTVQDQENDGWAVFSVVTDGANTLASTRLQREEFRVTTDQAGVPKIWNFDQVGRLNLPGNINGVYGNNNSFYAYDDGANGSVELKTISYIGDALGSNIRVTQSNATISTANAAHTWQFDNTGNLTAPGNVSTTGNVTVGYVIGNGSLLTNLPAPAVTQDITSNGAMSIMTYDGNIKYTNYATVEPASGNIAGGNISATGNVTANTFVGSGSGLTGVTKQTVGSWSVTAGTDTYSFTVPPNGTYSMWVRGNIPNGIIAWNATATVTNTNVPIVGQQFAWVYDGAGTPIDFVTIPNQFVGTANTVVRSNVSPSITANRFDFSINNTSGNTQTVQYGYITL